MSAEDAYQLNEAQTAYEQEDRNAQKAYLYFQELNRHHFYMRVITEYNTFNDRKLVTEKNFGQWATRVNGQYEYAMDHIKQVVSEDSTSLSTKNSMQQLWVDLIGAVFIIGVAFGAMYYFDTWKSFEQFGSPEKNNSFEIKKAKDMKERLEDVKGIDEIKAEINDLINMIKNVNDYTLHGAKLFKGVLLAGDPGTGKTLLARAIAGESGVNFIYCTGSNFDEMYVGMGAKRVRELFTEARKNLPCIIFIDEIDSLMSKSRRYGSEHSSSRGTINQLLAEMDGFEKNENIVVIGATNHEADLDPAAVRPGRFDKKIHVPRPDVNGRKEIFDLYLDKISKDEKVEAKKLGVMTPGFTGAEI